MNDPWKDFVGPCAHGRDPFTRCDACGRLTGLQAREWADLRAQLAARDELVRKLAGTVVELDHATRLSEMCQDEIEEARRIGAEALAAVPEELRP